MPDDLETRIAEALAESETDEFLSGGGTPEQRAEIVALARRSADLRRRAEVAARAVREHYQPLVDEAMESARCQCGCLGNGLERGLCAVLGHADDGDGFCDRCWEPLAACAEG